MVCPECNFPLKENETACPRCRRYERIRRPVAPARMSELKCAECTLSLEIGARMCPRCDLVFTRPVPKPLRRPSKPDVLSVAFQSASRASRAFGRMASAGLCVLAVGVLMMGYFFIFFDASVASGQKPDPGKPQERVMNMGLMADRQNGIMIGGFLSIIGTALLISGRVQSRTHSLKSEAAEEAKTQETA